MSYTDWKRSMLARGGVLAVAFVAGMLLEGMRKYSIWGIGLVAFFLSVLGAGLMLLADEWLERWFEHAQNGRSEWAEF
jgi:hypothetical protein